MLVGCDSYGSVMPVGRVVERDKKSNSTMFVVYLRAVCARRESAVDSSVDSRPARHWVYGLRLSEFEFVEDCLVSRPVPSQRLPQRVRKLVAMKNRLQNSTHASKRKMRSRYGPRQKRIEVCCAGLQRPGQKQKQRPRPGGPGGE